MANSISNAVIQKEIQVAVGIVTNSQGQLLVAKRPDHWLGGGCWEFPGGKIELNEDSKSALKRELLEEVGIVVADCTPFFHLSYAYPERKVFLDAWKVSAYTGTAAGLEGQEIAWCAPHALNELNMLPANRAIVVATQLPDTYAMSTAEADTQTYLKNLAAKLALGQIKLLQFSAENLSPSVYKKLASEVIALCKDHAVSLLLNYESIDLLQEINGIQLSAPSLNAGASDFLQEISGIHVSAPLLAELKERPVPKNKWLATTCHTLEELKLAEALKVDFVVFDSVEHNVELSSPLLVELINKSNIPVFIKRDLTSKNLQMAKTSGAQGLAFNYLPFAVPFRSS